MRLWTLWYDKWYIAQFPLITYFRGYEIKSFLRFNSSLGLDRESFQFHLWVVFFLMNMNKQNWIIIKQLITIRHIPVSLVLNLKFLINPSRNKFSLLELWGARVIFTLQNALGFGLSVLTSHLSFRYSCEFDVIQMKV